MGQSLTLPDTTKDSGDGEEPPKGLSWGYSGMQGWRPSMEDAHFAVPSLSGTGWTDTAAFGVMDGHGGETVARFCAHHLPVAIGRFPSGDTSRALTDAFHLMDVCLARYDGELYNFVAGGGDSWNPAMRTNPDWTGCTANVCLVRPSTVVVANAGDSRAVLCRGGMAVPLSEDHKPNMPGELERIQLAGGFVEMHPVGTMVHYRVNGNLNLSRAIGDLEYKKNARLQPRQQIICSTPDVCTYPRQPTDEFLIIACDGVWDVMGNQEAVDFVRRRLHRGDGRSLSSIAEDMLDHCISPDLSRTNGIGGDNMTVIIVAFRGVPPRASVPQLDSLSSLLKIKDMPVVEETRGAPLLVADDPIVTPSGICNCKLTR